ncbi:calcium-binding protein [Cereibacter sphaeroides]|uniref:calcium-binding protein n=1 Tax=Cereibacter sphaeroides TaxID=1063 RepID=UPI002277BF6E|nr:calcium-binding protein [Cereibacter sphaeroides]
MTTITGNRDPNRLIAPDWTSTTMYGLGGSDLLTGSFGGDSFIWGGIGNDTLEGGTGVNRLHGEAGNDRIRVFWPSEDSQLYGGAGNDYLDAGDGGNYLDGGVGVDTMRGGEGGDTFIVDNVSDLVEDFWVPEYDNVANPKDVVKASISYTLASGARIEVLETTDAAAAAPINLAGNVFAQTIKGNAGSNVLDGMGGNDVLIGGAGADRLIGGSGSDTASYETAVGGVTASLAKASRNTGDAAGDTYATIENLAGSKFNDRLYGNAETNKLSGGHGNDLLVGGLGGDILTGGAGADSFVFNTSLAAPNVDRITDFRVLDDTIRLENAVFAALSTGKLGASAFASNTSGKATDALDRLIYEKDSGALWYDADGNGSGARFQFATLPAGLGLTAADFLVI